MIYLKQKLSASELVSIASMLFGMFFGAGNLIFPIALGQYAGRNMWIAFIGLVITAVGIPLLGVTAIGISRSDGLIELSGKVNRGYSVFFTCALYLTIGPFFAIPRCAAVPFTIGVKPMLAPGASEKFSLAIFSVIFFIIVLGFSLFPGKILTWVGRILNPLFLIFLGVLVITALIKPMGVIHNAEPMGNYANGPFMAGFIEGYGTMDAIAGLAFGIVVIDVIRRMGVTNDDAIAEDVLSSGLLTGLLMALIYVVSILVGAQSRGLFELSENGGVALTQIAGHYLGGVGQLILAVTITFACLKTSIGLVTACAETFDKMTGGKFSYRGWAILFTAFSFAVSNVGLSAIINYSIPVLMLIYPPAIALITLAFIGRFFGHDRIVYIAVMIPTWIAALFDFMKTLPGSAQTALHLDAPIQFAAANLPLFDKNLGWLLPAVIGFAIGMIWHLSRPKNAAAA